MQARKILHFDLLPTKFTRSRLKIYLSSDGSDYEHPELPPLATSVTAIISGKGLYFYQVDFFSLKNGRVLKAQFTYN